MVKASGRLIVSCLPITSKKLDYHHATMITYKGFTITNETYGFTYVHLDNEDGTGKWSGIALTLEEAKAQIDELLDQ
jgi:hypothetical protein